MKIPKKITKKEKFTTANEIQNNLEKLKTLGSMRKGLKVFLIKILHFLHNNFFAFDRERFFFKFWYMNCKKIRNSIKLFLS